MRRLWVMAVVMVAAAALGQLNPNAIRFETKTLPSGAVGKRYVANLKLLNATPPLTWKVASGKLPPGLELPERGGTIAGVPTAPGTYKFRIAVTDGTGQTAAADFVIEIQNDLVIRWTAIRGLPRLFENTISGSVTVENSSKDPFDLTVIIVAVNENGKAFTLGYQKFSLAQNVEQDVRFEGKNMPNGSYIVHADAVAEVPSKKLIYRARLQTEQALAVQVNR